MNKKIYDIFIQIHAEEALKQKTANLLYNEIKNRRTGKGVSRPRLVSVLAAFVFVLFIGGYSYYMYFTPSAYIDIDVNPSVELTLNRFNHVIEVNPYNDDAVDILSMIDIRYATYKKAVQKLINTAAKQGYLSQNGLLSLTIQTTNSASENDILNELKITVNSVLKTHHSNAITDIFSVTEEVKNSAHENHVSPAKYIAIIELQQVDRTASFESCSNHSVSEIRQFTREHGVNHHDVNLTNEYNTGQRSATDDHKTMEKHHGNHNHH